MFFYLIRFYFYFFFVFSLSLRFSNGTERRYRFGVTRFAPRYMAVLALMIQDLEGPSLCPFIPEENGWVIYHRSRLQRCWLTFKRKEDNIRKRDKNRERQTNPTKVFFSFLRRKKKKNRKFGTQLPIAIMNYHPPFSLIEFGLNPGLFYFVCVLSTIQE
jgi:hypothetical protein